MKKLAKSKNNAVIFGVIGGLGEYFGIDPVLLRVIVVVATFIGVGSTIPIYLLLALVMPDTAGPTDRPSSRPNRPTSFGTFSDRPERKEAEKIDEEDWSDF